MPKVRQKYEVNTQQPISPPPHRHTHALHVFARFRCSWRRVSDHKHAHINAIPFQPPTTTLPTTTHCLLNYQPPLSCTALVEVWLVNCQLTTVSDRHLSGPVLRRVLFYMFVVFIFAMCLLSSNDVVALLFLLLLLRLKYCCCCCCWH